MMRFLRCLIGRSKRQMQADDILQAHRVETAAAKMSVHLKASAAQELMERLQKDMTWPR